MRNPKTPNSKIPTTNPIFPENPNPVSQMPPPSSSSSQHKRACTKNISSSQHKRPRTTKKNLSISISLDNRRFFSSHAQMETYLKGFVRRKLVEPKWMDLSFFAEEGFHFQQLIDSQGLKTFVSLNCNYFIELIKVFYCNLKMVDGDLVTEVKTTPIRITPSDWLAVTGLNHDGAKFSISAISNWEGYDRATAIRGMLKDSSVSVIPSKVMVGKLTVEDRMLHYAFAKILIPRGSNYSQLAEEDIFVLWALKNGILINWPYYISKHMMKVKKRHMMDLPYGFLITKFLFHFQIDTRNEGEVVTKGLNKFGWTAINHMKLKKVNGVWITTGDPAQAAREDEPHDMNAEELSLALVPAIAAPDDRFDLLIAQIQDLRNFIGERFDHLDSCVASLDERLKALEEHDRNHDEH